MKKILLLIFASAVSISALSCNYYDLDDAFGEAYDRAAYGNWCGPGRSGPDDPVDSLDGLCMNHDNCYLGKNVPYEDYASCTPDATDKLACDQTFVDGLNALDANSDNWGEEAPPAGMKAEAEQYMLDALLIFGQCVELHSAP